MVEIVTSSTFPGTDRWRQNTINDVSGRYDQWIRAAREVRRSWRGLVSDEAWTKVFDEEPRTEERLRKQMVGVKDERLWKMLTELLNLMDEVDEQERRRQEIERKRVQQESTGINYNPDQDIVQVARLVRKDIRAELSDARVSVTSADNIYGRSHSLTVVIKDMGQFEEEFLRNKIEAIILRYNRKDLNGAWEIGCRIELDFDLEWQWAVEESDRKGLPIDESVTRMRTIVDRMAKEKVDRAAERQRKKDGISKLVAAGVEARILLDSRQDDLPDEEIEQQFKVTESMLFNLQLQRLVRGAQQMINEDHQRKGSPGEPHKLSVVKCMSWKPQVKIVTSDTAAWAFIDLLTGDILKPDGWSKSYPIPRGSIFDEDYGLGKCTVYGPKSISSLYVEKSVSR